jgi:Uncharacterised nucleotidyltransferase
MATAAEIRPVLSEASDRPQIRPFAGNPEFDLLIACCADSSAPRADRIRKILSRPLDWERMLRFVDHHRVVPQVYGALSALPHLVPTQQLGSLRSRYQDNARKTLWFTAELVRILSHLESAGIKALPYKGPVLAETLYGEVTQRQFGDLDILILPTDVSKAKTALLDLGYKPSIELTPSDKPAYIETAYLETAYVETGYEYSFSAAHGANLLELQWRILPRFYSIDFNVEDFFKRADEISLGGQEMEDGRPRPSLCVTSAMREFADALATPQPLKNWTEVPQNSREAAADCSPRRKPWVESETPPSPSGAKDQLRPGLGSPMRTLRGEDLLLVLCVHAAKHVWVQLSWLCDIAQFVKSQQLNWNAIQEEAKRLGIERILSLNLLLAHKLLGAALPPQIQKRLREDPSPTVLADEILRIIERSTHYETESIPYFRLMMRLRERWQDRARFLWRLVFTPSISEWSAIRLPKHLHPLYRLVRLSRLAKRLTSATRFA